MTTILPAAPLMPQLVASIASDGRRRKDAAHDVLESRRAVYLFRARRALLLRLLEFGEAYADHVRDAVSLPEGIDAKLFGAVPGALARAGMIEAVGFATTTRPEAHARPVKVWRLRDRAAAEQWLADHPETEATTDHVVDRVDGPSVQGCLWSEPVA
jgi:hypothetical protein